MAKILATYDPAQFSIIVGGFPIQGFVKGSFVTIERDEASFLKYVGCDGEDARAKSNNKGAKIKLRLMHTSDSNRILSAFAKSDELSNAGAVPFYAKDGSQGNATAAFAETAWVEKYPVIERGAEISEVEWSLDTGNCQIFIGGN